MKLQSVLLENFKQYAGKHRITFSGAARKNVTVINGKNGAGKTNLFLAINWCLYGEGLEGKGEIISRRVTNEAMDGNPVDCRVEVAFTHKGEPHLASRRIRSKGSMVHSAAPSGELTLTRITASGDTEIIPNPVGAMNAILPSNVRTYFLFDGEKIDDFARPENRREVRDAVWNVLNIELLERAERHLDRAARAFSKEMARLSQDSEVSHLVDEENRLRERITDLKEEKGKTQAEEEAARDRLQAIEGKLAQLGDSADLMLERKRLRAQMDDLRGQQAQLDAQLRGAIPDAASLAAHSGINAAVGVLDEKRKRGEIPSGIRETFIKDLLKSAKCICGRPLSGSDDASRELRERLKASVTAELEDTVTDIHAELRSLLSRAEGQRESLRVLLQRRSDLVDAEDTAAARLDDLERRLDSIEELDVQVLRSKQKEFQAEVMRLTNEIGHLQGQIDEISSRVDEVRNAIQKGEAKDEQTRAVQVQVELARAAAERVAEIQADFADQMRVRIRSKAKEIFDSLVWKGGQWTDMDLNEEYELNILDRWGAPVLPELSAGERQVLSLSFILGMAEVAKREAPLVMDTPFGRLSTHHRETIARQVPKLSEQVILFVTDEELHGEARALLTPRIGAEYELDFDDKSGTTRIVKED